MRRWPEWVRRRWPEALAAKIIREFTTEAILREAAMRKERREVAITVLPGGATDDQLRWAAQDAGLTIDRTFGNPNGTTTVYFARASIEEWKLLQQRLVEHAVDYQHDEWESFQIQQVALAAL